METRAFPGNLEEAYRAGITPRIRSGTLDSSKLRAELVGLRKRLRKSVRINNLHLAEPGEVAVWGQSHFAEIVCLPGS